MRKNIWPAVLVFCLAAICSGCDSGSTYINVAEEEQKFVGTWQRITATDSSEVYRGFVVALELHGDKTTNVPDRNSWYTNGVSFCFTHKTGNTTEWYSYYPYAFTNSNNTLTFTVGSKKIEYARQ